MSSQERVKKKLSAPYGACHCENRGAGQAQYPQYGAGLQGETRDSKGLWNSPSALLRTVSLQNGLSNGR